LRTGESTLGRFSSSGTSRKILPTHGSTLPDYFRKMKKLILAVLLIGFCLNAFAAPECQANKVQNVNVEMCLLRGTGFQHDVYMLKANNQMIFALADDYVENVALEHVIPDAPGLEFPLSLQGEKSVRITGGCKPVSKDQTEIARVCNFNWGKYQVVSDVRFEFE
jgi:hypothetical protein